MNARDLQISNRMPFLCWVRDRSGRYLWGNSALADFAGRDVAGLTDRDMPWADLELEYMRTDEEVFKTGHTFMGNELVKDDEVTGQTYRVHSCKWLDEFEGQEAVFGIAWMHLDKPEQP